MPPTGIRSAVEHLENRSEIVEPTARNGRGPILPARLCSAPLDQAGCCERAARAKRDSILGAAEERLNNGIVEFRSVSNE